MKRMLLLSAFILIALGSMSQGLEFRIKGGINFQKSQSPDSEYSFLPHAGAMLGMRISTIGIYGEFLYSIHDNQNWPDQAAYLVPSALVRFYGFRMIFLEAGLSYWILADEQITGALIELPEKEFGYFVGLGFNLRKFEVGIRTTAPISSIQLTGTYRF